MELMDLVHPDCPNFRWYEVWKSDIASRLEIDNVSEDPKIIAAAQGLTKHILQPIRDEHGSVKMNSWFRCEDLERVITKKAFHNWSVRHNVNPNFRSSWNKYFALKSHPGGEAGDIELPGISNDDLYQWIGKNIEFDQCIREFPVAGIPDSGWVHVSWSATKNRKQQFEIGAR
jgi:hypothetical protein